MRTFTVLGPSGSGKSTLVRQLAGLEDGAPKTDSVGALTLTTFSFMDEDWCAIDLPGGAEAGALAPGALMATDAAVICVPPDPEAAILAAPALRAVAAARTPALIFINQMDAAAGRVLDIVAELQDYCRQPIVLRQVPIREVGQVVGAVDLISERAWRYRPGGPSTLVELPADLAEREAEARSDLLEHLSDFDDALLEELIEDRAPPADAIYGIAARETAETVVVPAFLGAALHRNGLMRLMKALRHEAPGVAALTARLGAEGLRAVTFQAETRKHLGKVVALRALDEGVATGSQLAGGNVGGLQVVGGGTVSTLAAGGVGLVVKSDHLPAQGLATAAAALPRPGWANPPPAMLARVPLPASEQEETRLATALSRLQDTDPLLQTETEEETGQPVLRLQGHLHLRRVLADLKDDFGLTVEVRAPHPVWRETISRQTDVKYRHRKQSGGAGQFADISITLRPMPRGEGFAFDEVVKGGAVPRNYIPAVAAGAREALGRGPLGFPVVDVAVTLTDGKHHAVDSSDHAFRTAARMGMRDGLAQAGPLLLQVIESVAIHVPSAASGSLAPLVSGLKGQVLGYDRDPDFRGWDVFRATMPATAVEDLVQALASTTQGTAWVETGFDHFEEVYGREAEAISKARLEALTHA